MRKLYLTIIVVAVIVVALAAGFLTLYLQDLDNRIIPVNPVDPEPATPTEDAPITLSANTFVITNGTKEIDIAVWDQANITSLSFECAADINVTLQNISQTGQNRFELTLRGINLVPGSHLCRIGSEPHFVEFTLLATN